MSPAPAGARELAGIIQNNPNTTNAQRAALGLTVLDPEPSPIPTPTSAPVLSIVATVGRSVKVRLRDSLNPDRRGKPGGVEGASILTFVGDAAPADLTLWSLAFNTGKTVVDVEFDSAVAAGGQVWITAFWFNPRKQGGPAATAVSTRLGNGIVQAA